MNQLSKEVTLQAQEVREGTTQFKVSVPSDFVNLAEWKKGEVLKMTFILGTGKVIIEKEV